MLRNCTGRCQFSAAGRALFKQRCQACLHERRGRQRHTLRQRSRTFRHSRVRPARWHWDCTPRSGLNERGGGGAGGRGGGVAVCGQAWAVRVQSVPVRCRPARGEWCPGGTPGPPDTHLTTETDPVSARSTRSAQHAEPSTSVAYPPRLKSLPTSCLGSIKRIFQRRMLCGLYLC